MGPCGSGSSTRASPAATSARMIGSSPSSWWSRSPTGPSGGSTRLAPSPPKRPRTSSPTSSCEVSMGRLDGRVAIVTGAGRGLGRCHALFMAAQGAAVLVNDRGSRLSGEGSDPTPAQRVVDEIRGAGGRAEVSSHDVSDWEQARAMVHQAVESFGALHVLVNNAGILRDRALFNMEEAEWDAVIRVHLKGHAATSRHALAYWRERAKSGHEVKASVVHTSSVAGYAGNFGQANYSSAKLAVVALSRVVALEGARYGVRSNVVSPGGRTRLSAGQEEEPERTDGTTFDPLDPANVSPLIGWLAEATCPAQSQVFHITGSALVVSSMPPILHRMTTQGRWTLEELDQRLPELLVEPVAIEDWFEGAGRR